ncbi:MAG: hypothetical protein B7Y80_19520 [Hyphomicrobium sp. 32-62-53]|nr:MAG: hypothetical protein B7Z29_16915 [Hyphomicrobium sp. 12-62-95]OYX97517.1 MAG: hypothetical protein B7Y80_19520 [Hyphomicrobium sp. 32-62-53]
MFDAKALLEQLAGNPQRSAAAPSAPGEGGGLADLIRNVTGGAGGGNVDQIMAQVREQAAKFGGPSGAELVDTLTKAFGQATEGVKEGATRIGDATGARDAVTNATGGRSTDEMIAQVKDLIANNQLGAGAVLGGLGAILLGTKTGRGVATGAAKIGALALIGGLAYKAYQNHQAGRPLITGPQNAATEAAPVGSGFEPDAISNDAAMHIIKAMIAAAAADGRIDDTEYARIVGAAGGAAASPEAKAFLERELRSPATAAQLAREVSSAEEALQVYTAARVAIDADNASEKGFLAELASALGIDADLAGQVDATARSTAA